MEDIVKEAREAIQVSYDFDRDNRREAMEDLRFVAGFQWSDAAMAERKGRPMITINRSGQFLRQVSNPIRKNMPVLKVTPDSDEDEELAEVANGLFRRIQYNSSASHVYAQAVEHMVACGIGWFRVVTDYLDNESFDQEILIKRVFNPLSVYPDPSSLEPDRNDMNWCVVSELMPKTAFEKRWPGKGSSGIDTPTNGATGSLNWGQGDYVRVGEFWKREEVKKTLVRLKDGSTHDMATFPKSGFQRLKELGAVAGTRETKTYKVTMTMVSGEDVLEEVYECPCQWIPLIPVIGAEIPLEQGIYRHGLIRFQREPQQLHNYFMSVAAESLGQQVMAPFIGTATQFQGYKNVWDNANKRPVPYLPYTHDDKAPGPPQRVAPPQLSSGLIQMAEMLAEDMKATTGIYDAALGNRSNETSGIAINARVNQGNEATLHFSDNLEHGLEHLGRIILDMIPSVYDTQRTLRLMGHDDTETEVQVNTPTVQYNPEVGAPEHTMINDLSQMKFKAIRVVMGPSYATKRQETAQSLIELTKSMPQIGQLGADIIIKSLDFDGAEQLAERLKMGLPPQILAKENPQDQAPPPQPPDPMQDPAYRADVELKNAQAFKTVAEAYALGATAQMQNTEMQVQPPPPDPNEQAQAMFAAQAAQHNAQQAQHNATAAGHKAVGAQLQNALTMNKLSEPPPQAVRPAGQAPQ